MTAANETAGQKYHLAMATHHEAVAKEHEKLQSMKKIAKYKLRVEINQSQSCSLS